jgi:hypothetical protein
MTAARFARLVTAVSATGLKARLYSFEEGTGEAKVRLWKLRPGVYRWRAGERSGQLVVDGLPADVTVAMPGRREVELVIERAP